MHTRARIDRHLIGRRGDRFLPICIAHILFIDYMAFTFDRLPVLCVCSSLSVSLASIFSSSPRRPFEESIKPHRCGTSKTEPNAQADVFVFQPFMIFLGMHVPLIITIIHRECANAPLHLNEPLGSSRGR